MSDSKESVSRRVLREIMSESFAIDELAASLPEEIVSISKMWAEIARKLSERGVEPGKASVMGLSSAVCRELGPINMLECLLNNLKALDMEIDYDGPGGAEAKVKSQEILGSIQACLDEVRGHVAEYRRIATESRQQEAEGGNNKQQEGVSRWLS